MLTERLPEKNSSYDALESLPVLNTAVPIKHCDGAGDDTIDCASVEGDEDFRWQTKLLQVSALCVFVESVRPVRPGGTSPSTPLTHISW